MTEEFRDRFCFVEFDGKQITLRRYDRHQTKKFLAADAYAELDANNFLHIKALSLKKDVTYHFHYVTKLPRLLFKQLMQKGRELKELTNA